MAAHLRVFAEPFETCDPDRPEPAIRVSLRDLLPLIALAKRNNYLWLQDFLEDEVEITSDLYEVLQAFSACRKTPA